MAIKSRIVKNLARFARDQAGATAIIFSLSAVAVCGCAGAAIDYVNTIRIGNEVLANLDAAVLAGVSSSLKDDFRVRTAQTFFDSYQMKSNVKYDVKFEIDNGSLVGKIQGSVPTTLLQVVGIESLPLVARSVGVSNETREPACFMAMHPNRKHTLELKDTVSVIAPDCHIYGNSDHYNDVVDPHSPENFLTGKSIAAIGGGHHYLENVSPPVEFGTRLVADPLATLNVPAPGACTKSNLKISSGSSVLPPGHYCGGLEIEAGAKVTLEQGGTYFISGGAFAVTSSSVSGTDVTVFLIDSSTNIYWQEAKVQLSAKKTGVYAGIVVFGARVDTTNEILRSTVDTYGAFYMPRGAFTWENEGEPAVTAKWQSFILDGVTWQGSGTIRYNFDISNSDIPFPKSLNAIPRPSEVRITQ